MRKAKITEIMKTKQMETRTNYPLSVNNLELLASNLFLVRALAEEIPYTWRKGATTK